MASQGWERGIELATYVVLAAIGVLSAVIESFLVPQRVFGGIEGLSALLAFVGNAVVGAGAGIGLRSRAAAVVPTAAWFVTVGVLTTYEPGGDVVMPGALPADPGVVKVVPALLIFGILGGGLALLLTILYTDRVRRPTPQR